MPLQVVCPACNAKLKAPDTAAGKKTKCPKCQAVVTVPVDAPQAPTGSPVVKKTENWHMQTTDGSQFGPVPRSELDEWFKEGRISADCQLLKEGADQWQWASEVYPSLDQAAPVTVPTKQDAAFDFLGPATPASNDPLGLGNAALGMTPVQSPAFGYQAPAFPAAAPSFGGGYGGGSSYGGGGGYGVSSNPYSSPSISSYGNYGSYGSRQARSSLHPMVIVAACIEFFYGGMYVLASLGLFVFMLALLVGGAGAAANLPANDPNSEKAGAALAAISGMGMLCILPFLLLFLGLSILMISTGVGLLKRRFWARIVSMVLSILFLLIQCFTLLMSLRFFDPCSLATGLVGITLQVLILVPMCVPDWTSDFS
ncbi:MAG: GYF domain-containing protein [Planctomycetales bacterium]|nr:GYF domain-containing protein [Planctomycetales bacterium]